MSKAFDQIKTGLDEAIDFAQEKKTDAIVHRVDDVDVKALRRGLNMTQEVFAATFGISLGTLRHWERGDRQPIGPARVLLRAVSRSPKAVLKALV